MYIEDKTKDMGKAWGLRAGKSLFACKHASHRLPVWPVGFEENGSEGVTTSEHRSAVCPPTFRFRRPSTLVS
jgi:hypothetical protein